MPAMGSMFGTMHVPGNESGDDSPLILAKLPTLLEIARSLGLLFWILGLMGGYVGAKMSSHVSRR